ncbi:MAG: hypothetical protein SPK70_09790 [Succinivibrio dextrinosolvens]|nr:hypothetical protein [Succinivibrio dextrinosolvens]MDY6471345.1 hypothetical protein [Succinivibrio dextrinosolvens]
MRFLSLLLFALMLLFVNGRVYACEHSSDSVEIVGSSVSYSSYKKETIHKTYGSKARILQINYCCSGIGMSCCLSVSNTLNFSKSIHQFSERRSSQTDNYKSYIAYMQQRPPCSSDV